MTNRIVTVPNLVTVFRAVIGCIGIVLTLCSGVLFYVGWITFLFAVVCDSLDGFLARKLNQESRVGEIIDPIVDKILFYGIVFIHFLPQAWIAVFTILIAYDIISTIMHIAKPGGAVKSGKLKFVLQSAALFVIAIMSIIKKGFIEIAFVVDYLPFFINGMLLVATVFAIFSLKKRLELT